MSTAAHWHEAAAENWQATGTEGGGATLQQVAADRLAAHRQRRAAAAVHEAELEARTRQHREAVRRARTDDQRRGASQVREAVAARYGQRESYREFLAAEAERAIRQAEAEAEIAQRNAEAIAQTQMALLEELEQFRDSAESPREQALAFRQAETRNELAHALADIALGARELIAEPSPGAESAGSAAPQPAAQPLALEPAICEISSAGLTVRLFEDIPAASSLSVTRPSLGRPAAYELPHASEGDAAEVLSALDEEIDFRRAPAFAQATSLDTQAIPGNLIEFPRELVAPRRARPRLAEGPLCEAPGALFDAPQLRIFEVEAEQATLPLPAPLDPHVSGPEWQSLQLSGFAAEPAEPSSGSDAQTHLTLPLHTAPLERRLMSAAVDLCAVGFAALAALVASAEIAGPALRTLPPSLLAGAGLVGFGVLGLVYQLLFFTLADATPGMRYARIALCTFGDGNPSRRAMRRRVFSAVLAACPLGLGLAWALLDNDRLGWHDRISRMYQRAY